MYIYFGSLTTIILLIFIFLQLTFSTLQVIQTVLVLANFQLIMIMYKEKINLVNINSFINVFSSK